MAESFRRPSPWLHRYAVLVAAATLALIVAGGLVTSTESGLSVPDWPTTYGYNMFTFPLSKMVGGIRFEHTHRLIASTVGLLTLILAVWLARREERRWVRRMGYVAVAAVIAQGILGGLTVIYLLPRPISVAHGCLAQLFFCLTVAIAVVTSPRWREAAPPSLAAAFRRTPAARVAALTAAVVFLQLLVGAIMRHSKAGLAIPDFPLSLGRVVPPLDTFPVAIAFAHRVGALVVAAFVVAAAVRAHASGRPRLARAGLALAALVVVQIALGALTVLSGKSILVATAHVATGALILASTVALSVGALALERRHDNVVPLRPALSRRASGWK
jgi:cytochrome c oxidase assembly protein subunit 15